MKREPHQMRGAELRSTKEELENRLQSCHDPHERQALRHQLDELDAELRRRSQIGRGTQAPSEQEMSGGGENPGHR